MSSQTKQFTKETLIHKLTKGQIEAIVRALDAGVYPDVDTPQLRAARKKLVDGLTLLKAPRAGRKEKLNARARRPRRHP